MYVQFLNIFYLYLNYFKNNKYKYGQNSNNCSILLQFKINVFYLNIFSNVIYSCDGKAGFSASLLQSSVSHDPSEIIQIKSIKYACVGAQNTFLIIIRKTVILLFMETILFRILWYISISILISISKFAILFLF